MSQMQHLAKGSPTCVMNFVFFTQFEINVFFDPFLKNFFFFERFLVNFMFGFLNLAPWIHTPKVYNDHFFRKKSQNGDTHGKKDDCV